ncbi:MAG: hypothetical protein AAF358_04960 [Pseudomonadota bacterium]
MNPQPAEHIVMTSEPVYRALTPNEHLALQRIRQRARSSRRPSVCAPVSERLARAWFSALVALMTLRWLLAITA